MARKSNGNPVPIKDILNKLTIEELNIKGKRVFIRADYNVPLDDNLSITDDRRIRSTLPTIDYAIDEGAKVILASHLGRPKGKVDPSSRLLLLQKDFRDCWARKSFSLRTVLALRSRALFPR